VITAAVYRPGQVYQLRWDRHVLRQVKATPLGQLAFTLPATGNGISGVLAISLAS
jgi:hypothetical protein